MSSEQAGDGVEVQSSFQVVEDQQNGEAVGSRVGEQGIADGQKAPENELLIDGGIPSEEIAPTVLVPAEEATESGQIEIQQHQQENGASNEAMAQIAISTVGGTPVTLSNLQQMAQATDQQEVTQIAGLPPGVSLIQADQGQEGEGAIFLLVTGPVDGEGGAANAIAVDAATAAAMASLQNPLEAVSGGQQLSIEELATVVSSSAGRSPGDSVAEILSNLTGERVATSTDEAAVVQVAATAEAQAAATSKAYPSPSEVSLAQDILALASTALSSSGTTTTTKETDSLASDQGQKNEPSEDIKARMEEDGKPSWAFLLHDFQKIGESYFGYVMNEVEMDQVLNCYKKETNSLFAIRQTPSPVKDETGTVRLMWKSQHVPYDGVPFINIGRRATVMECEHGPRKKTNALKRLFNSSPVDKASLKSVVNLTCPARVFIKKVRKFPEFKVVSTTDPKILRSYQEQSLKQLRELGMSTWTGGEVRLYMQLPDSGAHRYHLSGSVTPSTSSFETSGDNGDYKTDIDNRVVTKIKEVVRQGVHSPFVVRQIARHFVDKEMGSLGGEKAPKHDKSFYPTMIEIQNLTQQIQADLLTGALTPLPTPAEGFPQTKAKKRRSSMKSYGEPADKKPTVNGDNEVKAESGEAIGMEESADATTIGTFSLTLPEGQLENFSIANLNIEQLQQLAKIGLLALNNATTGKSSNVPMTTATVTESGSIEIESIASQAESSSAVETSEQISNEAVVLLTSSIHDQVSSTEAEEAVQAMNDDMTSPTSSAQVEQLPSMVLGATEEDKAEPSTTTSDDSAISTVEATTTTQTEEASPLDNEEA